MSHQQARQPSGIVVPKRIILAQPRGFCAGVVRAIDIVERSLEQYGQHGQHGAPVYVRHEIVHNRAVVDRLKTMGARFVEEIDQVPAGAVTIFSAHGVSREVEAQAQARGLRTLDATCPLVAKVHAQSRHYAADGRVVLLIGHAGHPEVEGTLGQVDTPMILVQNEREAELLDLPADAPVAYVTQTTLSVDDTRGIIAVLQRRFPRLVGPDIRDICYATQNRQHAVRELCRRVDVLLVVGAANSSNSNRLREIGAESGIPSYLLADGNELHPDWVIEARVVGITAGASAPEGTVQHVIAALRALAEVEVTTMEGREEHVEFRLPPQLMDLQGD